MMCQFFSCISDGKGKVIHFELKDIVECMAKENPKNYEWNSHTSMAHFNGILGADEDKWNKWEYNPEKKELKIDSLNTTDDSKQVKKYCVGWFKDKDIGYLRNLYNWNSGDWNSGYRNSGNRNSGYRNSGDGNSGNRNSGYRNSGDRNSGYRNSGDRNSGNWNSGDRNSGDRNSGYRNSGDGNSGNGNSGTVSGHFCSEKIYMMFNKPCTEEEYKSIYNLPFSWFDLTEWINEDKMSPKKKKEHPYYKTIGGYLKTYSYKDAWKKCPKEVRKIIKQLPNFDKKVFKEITGLSI